MNAPIKANIEVNIITLSNPSRSYKYPATIGDNEPKTAPPVKSNETEVPSVPFTVKSIAAAAITGIIANNTQPSKSKRIKSAKSLVPNLIKKINKLVKNIPKVIIGNLPTLSETDPQIGVKTIPDMPINEK